MWISSIIELYLIIVAASAPALKPFFRQFFTQKRSRSTRGRSRSGGTSVSPSLGRKAYAPNTTDLQTQSNIVNDLEKGSPIQGQFEQRKKVQSRTWYEVESDSEGETLESYEMQRTRLSATKFDRQYPTPTTPNDRNERGFGRFNSVHRTPTVSILSRQISNDRHSV